jgi:transposase
MDAPDCPGCRERDARIAVLEARVLALEGQVRDLLDQRKPPPPPRAASTQPPAPAKKPTGRKPGAQTGHPPHLKTLVPPERVNTVVPFVPQQCDKCRTPLPDAAGPDDPAPTRHQVAELPVLAAHITEYQGHYRTCPCCGEVTHAPIPAELRAYSVGPRLTATLSYFAGCHGVSKRGIEEITAAVFDAPVALGTVANLEQEVSAALAPAHQEAVAAIATAPVKHVDETGWKQAGKKRWLWAAATATVVAFVIHPRRNLTALLRLVGETITGILCSDRWCVYDEWPLAWRQVCWAHLKRNWEKLAERGGKAARVCGQCLDVQRRVFEMWHLFRGGGCTRADLDTDMLPLLYEMQEALLAGRRSRDRKLARFCRRLLEVFPALWTFVCVEGVEPTNNHAERVQRRAVLWRRRSFGCHSAAGCRFVERILTAVQTLRLQKRSVLEFLYETVRAHRAGLPAPRLVTEG